MVPLLLVILLAQSSCEDLFFQQQPIINQINDLHTTWKAGHNHYFDGRTLEQISGLMGSLETPKQFQLLMKDITPLENIPSQFFSAEQWPNCESIKQIRDQSACGSCWAFGAVQVMSDRICIASGQRIQVRISAQDLLTCCGNCGYGCGGGYASLAFNYWLKPGITTGWLYNTTGYCQPYSFPPCDHHQTGKYEPCGKIQPTPSCKAKCISGYETEYKQDRWKASDVYIVSSNPTKIQTQIINHGPVQGTFTVHSDFLTYKSGVYQHTHGSKVGLHAIKIVGWGEQNNVKYWLVANSWNEDWGDQGFFKIRRDVNECGIEAQVTAGVPLLKSEFVTE